MAKATTIKDALKRWEDKTKQSSAEAKDIELIFQMPPIEKMDNLLSNLVNCEKLSLSTNMIDKVYGIQGMNNLKILSLSRNYIKAIAGLESVADTLEELWLSYNLIEKLKGINVLKNLKILYISNNLIKEWPEFNRLQEVPLLENLVFVGNPLIETMEEAVYKVEAAKRLPTLKKLDGETLVREESEPV